MQKFIATGLQSPMRLDRYLRTLSPDLTQGLIEKALRKGDIRIDDTKVKSSTRIEDGKVISIAPYIKISNEPEDKEFAQSIVKLSKKLLDNYLLLDHKDFFAIFKPAGVSSQGGSNISLSIDHALQYLNTVGHDLRLVHRLDKETSGVMLIARNRLSATKLGEAFQNGLIKKQYLAKVSGKEIPDEGRIESYLSKVHDRIVEGGEEAKLAITDYRVISRSKGGIKLIEFKPETGRMHQIRCHAAFNLHNPIIGDDKYGGFDCDHLLLHAERIMIPQDIFGAEILIKAKIPEYF